MDYLKMVGLSIVGMLGVLFLVAMPLTFAANWLEPRIGAIWTMVALVTAIAFLASTAAYVLSRR
jgi:hypothetical protein